MSALLNRQVTFFSTYRQLSSFHVHVALIEDLTGEHQARVGRDAAELRMKNPGKPIFCVFVCRTYYHEVDDRHPIVVPRYDTDAHDWRERRPLFQVMDPYNCESQ
jgi:hypothetical protein